jgi:uncharacterized membrane protein (DUF106 family)
MANIGSIDKKSAKKASASVSGAAAKTSIDRIGNLAGEVANLKNWVYFAVFVLLIGLVLAIGSYFLMTKDSFNDYKNTLNEVNNERYHMLENRIQQLENRLNATQPPK